MKITIDTKEDSHEDIKKVIGMLRNLVGEDAPSNRNIFETESPEISPDGNVFGNLFGSSAEEKEETQKDQETEEDKTPPTIEFY